MLQLPFQLLAPRVELDHPVLHLICGNACDDCIHQLLVVALGTGERLFLFLAVPGGCRLQPVALGSVFFAEDLHRVRIH
ncbi:hypothetical protein [Leisingera sp. M527]|uniref:hypothetical protein n=1 Tax=Leisingera sp. M527 TaxID=2867014 RepID=UPI002882FBF0|nr:hypothetical protein [Leisingera sp. M527]